MKRLLVLLVATLISGDLSASGYHPPFDRAVAEAELVVLGEVIDAWSPRVVSEKPDPGAARGRVFRLRVIKAYKGATRPGQEIVFVDPHHMSTASYRVQEGGHNLTFLVKHELADFDRRRFDFQVKELYRPIRNLSTESIFGEGALEGWLYLLDHFVAEKPGDLTEKYRKILSSKKNREVLHYVVSRWPDSPTEADIRLLQDVVLRHMDDAYIVSPAVERLAKAGARFEPAVLKKLLKNGSPYLRGELLTMVNASNVAEVQELLFAFLTQDEPEAEQEIIEVLAKHAPAYLREKLQRVDLPAWKLVPCLKALGVNGSAVGKPDYPNVILSANPYTLRMIGEVIQGNEFWGVLAMNDPQGHGAWEPLFPLFRPVLEGVDNPTRRMVVAMMRSFGKRVVRDGNIYKLVDEPGPAPIRLRLETKKTRYRLDEPVTVTIVEEAVATTTVSLKGPLGWHTERPDNSTTMSGGFFHQFKDVSLPREDFVLLPRGETRKTAQKMTSWFDRPGRYKLSAKKLYKHDGGAHGLDAWTGVVRSAPIEIEIYE